ncbi:uncharacterized protein LOC110102502 [Dendrobium catenatum]|uniref:non-specific serine/threonine protein kinase n=1 Tax=Dendrobium catenatum TaxID=906689 RepID=A0A2I0VHR1_9ASPA|nr:uncharacterized protein LOC110102502 [Dendrobium catenatum]PKU62952.1 Serine/threonine-protein kinase SAPK1 [Dendrobium catenatum]
MYCRRSAVDDDRSRKTRLAFDDVRRQERWAVDDARSRIAFYQAQSKESLDRVDRNLDLIRENLRAIRKMRKTSATIPRYSYSSSSISSSASRRRRQPRHDYPPLELPLRWRDPPPKYPPLDRPMRWPDSSPDRAVRNHPRSVFKDSYPFQHHPPPADMNLCTPPASSTPIPPHDSPAFSMLQRNALTGPTAGLLHSSMPAAATVEAEDSSDVHVISAQVSICSTQSPRSRSESPARNLSQAVELLHNSRRKAQLGKRSISNLPESFMASSYSLRPVGETLPPLMDGPDPPSPPAPTEPHPTAAVQAPAPQPPIRRRDACVTSPGACPNRLRHTQRRSLATPLIGSTSPAISLQITENDSVSSHEKTNVEQTAARPEEDVVIDEEAYDPSEPVEASTVEDEDPVEERAWKAKMFLQKIYFYYTPFNSSHRYILMPDGVERHLVRADDTKNCFIGENNVGNDAAALMSQLAPKAKALRDEKWKETGASILVPRNPLKVDQPALAEESLPVTKCPGDAVYSRSTYKQGEIEAVGMAALNLLRKIINKHLKKNLDRLTTEQPLNDFMEVCKDLHALSIAKRNTNDFEVCGRVVGSSIGKDFITGVEMPDLNAAEKVDSVQCIQTVRRNDAKGFNPNLKRLEEIVQKLDKVPAEAFLTCTHLAIVMEYAIGGEMFEIIWNTRRFVEDEARFFFQQLISGVSYCHSMQICPRSLKLENTSLDGSIIPRPKICDFGYSKSSVLHSQPKSMVGTPAYIALEVLCRKQYDGKVVDVWSCGGWSIEWQRLSRNSLIIGTALLEAIKATAGPSTKVVFSENRDAYFIRDNANVFIGIFIPYLNGFVSKLLVFIQIWKQKAAKSLKDHNISITVADAQFCKPLHVVILKTAFKVFDPGICLLQLLCQ